ncbi:MAG TPA: hypothetical protein PLX25_08940 [Sphaerochaeta sp.]|jgi:hypothetical protein|nr:hypothetical protein [Sphaerochaeta sp.]HPZ16781.1 hypothetical protein [Sphaerochaeta sp.]
MALYITNTGLEALVVDGAIDERQLLAWYEEGETVSAQGGSYRTVVLESGLAIIFRVVEDEIVGIDMHMKGRSIWTGKPLLRVGEQEPLSITLLMTSQSERSAFIATLVHAATLPQFDEDSALDLQVCAFVQALDIYDSRASYEEATPLEMQIGDKKILPYNFIMSRDEAIAEDERERFALAQTLVLIAAPVIAVETRSHGFGESSCIVATVGTEMGHLDLVFSESQVPTPLKKGAYITTQCAISADVLIS